MSLKNISNFYEKIKISYQKMSIQVKASLWFVVCNCLQKATQIITTPIYTRIMSTKQYGEYTVFLSWVELVAIFATLDIFYSGYNVGMEKFKTDRRNYTSAMHGLCIFLTSIWVVIGFLFADKLSVFMGLSSNHIKWLFLYMYIYPIYLFWSAQKKYDYNYKILLIVTTIGSFFTILAGAFSALKVEDKSTAVIVSKIIVELIIALPLFISSINGVKSLINKFYWKYALKFNIPLIPHYLSTMILNHSDRIMILNMCGASDAAIYSVAYSIAMLMTIVQNAINNAMIPWLYEKLSIKKYNGMKKNIIKIIMLIACLNLALITIAPELVKILSSKEYYEAIWVIPPVSFGVFLTCIYGFFVNVEFYYESNKLAAFASLVAALFNLILNFIFIKKIGYMAAGYTTLVSYLLLVIVHYFGLKIICKRNSINLNDIFDIKKIMLIIVSFALITCVIVSFYKLAIVRYMIIILMIISVAKFGKTLLSLKKE